MGGEDDEDRPKKEKHRTPLMVMKKQLRDLRRLIDRPGMPEEIKSAKEAELEALEAQMQTMSAGKSLLKAAQAEKERQEKWHQRRYKGVKWVERTKIERTIRNILKGHEDPADSSNPLPRDLEELRRLLNYIHHFPRSGPIYTYFSVIKRPRDESLEKQKQVMEDVSRRVDAGELEDHYKTYLAELQEKLSKPAEPKPPKKERPPPTLWGPPKPVSKVGQKQSSKSLKKISSNDDGQDGSYFEQQPEEQEEDSDDSDDSDDSHVEERDFDTDESAESDQESFDSSSERKKSSMKPSSSSGSTKKSLMINQKASSSNKKQRRS